MVEKPKKFLEINELFHLKFSTENYTDIKKKGYHSKGKSLFAATPKMVIVLEMDIRH